MDVLGGHSGTANLQRAGSEGIRSPGVQAYFIFVMLAGSSGRAKRCDCGVVCALLGLGLVVGGPRLAVCLADCLQPTARWLLTCVYIGVALLTMRLGTRAVGARFDRAQRSFGSTGDPAAAHTGLVPSDWNLRP